MAKLLTAEAAVELLTARKTAPHEVRVAGVLDRLADQRERQGVARSVATYWAPLPARAKTRRRVVESWGPGVQLGLFEGIEGQGGGVAAEVASAVGLAVTAMLGGRGV
jgi:hypothetical protein